MTKSEGIKIVSEWEAERELLNRGYTKEPCHECDGKGHFATPLAGEDASLLEERPHFWGRVCDRCEGHGWRWAAPLVRELPSETKTTT